jgi:hypothetical protein
VTEGRTPRLDDARAAVEEWERTLKILRLWHESTKHMGISLLEVSMEHAVYSAESDLKLCRRRLERAEGALQ